MNCVFSIYNIPSQSSKVLHLVDEARRFSENQHSFSTAAKLTQAAVLSFFNGFAYLGLAAYHFASHIVTCDLNQWAHENLSASLASFVFTIVGTYLVMMSLFSSRTMSGCPKDEKYETEAKKPVVINPESTVTSGENTVLNIQTEPTLWGNPLKNCMPIETLLLICSFCSPEEIFRLRPLSRGWRMIVEQIFELRPKGILSYGHLQKQCKSRNLIENNFAENLENSALFEKLKSLYYGSSASFFEQEFYNLSMKSIELFGKYFPNLGLHLNYSFARDKERNFSLKQSMPHVKSLATDRVSLSADFCTFIKCFPNLEKLILSVDADPWSFISGEELTFPSHLPNLKYLEFDSCSANESEDHILLQILGLFLEQCSKLESLRLEYTRMEGKDKDLFATIHKFCSNLKEISCSQLSTVSDEGFQELAQLERLESLSIPRSDKINFSLVQNMPRVKRLETDRVNFPTPADFCTFIEHFPNLEKLSLSVKDKHWSSFSGEGLTFPRHLSNLKYLRFASAAVSKTENSTLLQILGLFLEQCSNLESLRLAFIRMEGKDKDLFAKIHTFCSNLKEIFCDQFFTISDEGLQQLAQLERLESLSISHKGEKALNFSGFHAIKHFTYHGKAIDNRGFEIFIKNSSNLETLRVPEVSLTHEILGSIAGKNLKTLSLCVDSLMVCSEEFKKLLSSCRQLTVLSLRGLEGEEVVIERAILNVVKTIHLQRLSMENYKIEEEDQQDFFPQLSSTLDELSLHNVLASPHAIRALLEQSTKLPQMHIAIAQRSFRNPKKSKEFQQIKNDYPIADLEFNV